MSARQAGRSVNWVVSTCTISTHLYFRTGWEWDFWTTLERDETSAAVAAAAAAAVQYRYCSVTWWHNDASSDRPHARTQFCDYSFTL